MADFQFETYLKNQTAFRTKWRDYFAEAPNFDLSHRLENLTPFNQTPTYEKLTEENKNDLFLNHIRLMAEALIVFEQVLLYGYYTTRNKPSLSQEQFSKPFAQFTYEELYHSMGFRHFLAAHEVFAKFPHDLITRKKWLKNTFAFIVRHSPGALYICSPRLEALSLAYYGEINRAYGKGPGNSWLKLHQLHYQDEIYHIPLNYHFHDAFIKENGFFNTLIGAVVFFFWIQVMLLTVSYGAISQSFPKKSNFAKVLMMFKYIKWSLKVSESHREAKPIMERYFNKMKPRYSLIFSFLKK